MLCILLKATGNSITPPLTTAIFRSVGRPTVHQLFLAGVIHAIVYLFAVQYETYLSEINSYELFYNNTDSLIFPYEFDSYGWFA